MTTRTTAIIAAITVVVAVYMFVIDHNYNDTESRNFSAIPVSNTDEIGELKITSASGTIILERDSKDKDNWNMTAPVNDRADAKQIEELLTTLVNLKKQQDIKGENAPSIDTMGLNDPDLELTLGGLDGKQIGILKFGNDAGFVDSIYARWEEETPFACWSDARLLAEVAHDALRDIRLLAIPVEKMWRVKVQQGTEASLVMEGKPENSPWIITKPLRTGADPDAVSARRALIANLSASGFIDNPDSEVTAAFATGSKTVSVWRRSITGPVRMQLAKSPDGKTGYAKVSDRAPVFRIDPKLIDEIGINPNDLRDKRLMPFNPKSVLAIEIHAKPNHKVSLMQDNNGWQVIETEKKTQANRQRVYRMLKALAVEQVRDFMADAAIDLSPYGLDKPTLTLTITTVQQDPENPTKDDGSPNLISAAKTLLVKGQVAKNQDIIEYYATVKDSGTVVRLSPAFPPIIPIRPLDFKTLYLWPSFNLANLRSIKTSKPPQPELKLDYLHETNKWTGSLAGEDISARIDTGQALKLAQQLSLPIRATRWLSKNPGDGEIALLNPIRHIEFVLADAKGEQYTYKIDIAPINPDGANTLFYARVNDNPEMCVMDRLNFEILDLPVIRATSPVISNTPPGAE
ncbi:MAG: DUF4340 domain-containing protein [Verrucomicrobiales bacterium]|nr:DUF4340 domain-containing protein [Verrucomicrobiales bacterium]MED5586398.1 DUF4340 domain-containing protein [Verrucomicrobiota bacterium]